MNKDFTKRVTAFLTAVLMMVMTVVSVLTPEMTVHAAGKTLIVHYGGREDNKYDGWNLWIWEEGKEGQSIKFSESDDFGQIAVYQTNYEPERIGFIIRLNEWEAKDVDGDRYVEMNGDTVEIWVTSKQEEIATEAPEGAVSYDIAALEKAKLEVYNEEDALKLNVHYYNFAKKYTEDFVEAYAWAGNTMGSSYPLSEKDQFGAFFKVGLKPEDGVRTAGVKVIQDGNVDTAMEYEIDITKAVDNTLDVYIVEGNPVLWYNIDEAVYDPVISSAYFAENSSSRIYMTLSRAETNMDKVAKQVEITDASGTKYTVTSAESEDGHLVLLNLEEELKLLNDYKVKMNGYQEASVSMDKIIGSKEFDEQMAYDGDDLGAVYTKEKTTFKVWAPTASDVKLNLYEQGDGNNLIETIDMTAEEKGIWKAEKTGDLNGTYYTYTVKVGNKSNETVDLYARTTGVNGDRGMVVDLNSTNPEGFENDVRPEFSNPTDAVIYEVHVRDLSSDKSSGIKNVGKFLGFTELGTTNSNGEATGLDHIKDLGITHVQILPMYDYATVDETKLDTEQFNWGYDPKNYNTPEGSYSTDPYHGEVRIKEMKQMIQTLHENGLRVNMDVVFNHTYSAEQSWFQKTVPDYYYRKDGSKFTNGSGCGNETASEHAMVRKYIVDSVVYWAKEYHIDGFRFDLMAVHDKDTMRAVRAALDEVDPSIMVYGEGWTGGESGLPALDQSLKASIYTIDGVGAFSDDIRDGIRGHVFELREKGFISGKEGMESTIKFSAVGAVPHPQIVATDKGTKSWTSAPGQSINYASCHDNLTLWDKIAMTNEEDSEEDRIKMNMLSSAIVITSQGVPFMQAGEEMLRTKPSATNPGEFEENSYVSPDSTNSIKWDNKGNVIDVYNYYKGLIAFRKAHPALRMVTKQEIQENIRFEGKLDKNVVAYTISNNANGDNASKIMVIFNANKDATKVTLPIGNWDICVNDKYAGTGSLGTAEGTVLVAPISAMVLVQGDTTIEKSEHAADNSNISVTETSNADETKTEKKTVSTPLAVGAAAVGVAAIAAAAIVLFGRRKK